MQRDDTGQAVGPSAQIRTNQRRDRANVARVGPPAHGAPRWHALQWSAPMTETALTDEHATTHRASAWGDTSSRVTALEDAMAARFDARHAIAVGSPM